jgi:uncharacterized protein DUF6130
MTMLIKTLAAVAAGTVLATSAFAQSAREVGLPPGQHKVLIELANPEHHIFTGQTVTFTVPGPGR